MSDHGPLFRLRLLSGSLKVERVGRLTPYALETIVDGARRMGLETWLDLAVSADADGDCLVTARRRFERLVARGVRVRVHRDPDLDLLRPRIHPAAA
ncbi:MAG TPA: hypothetical protein VEM57_01810 [Candidatus Binatus sp.]|nr:hypothetical protein [Candidatus Binatus sp.]